MHIGNMEISDEFAADLLEGLRRGATPAFRRELAKVALDHATRDLPPSTRKAPDLNGDRDDGDPDE